MNKITYILILFFCCFTVNADQLSDQMKALEAVQEKNDAEARDLARVQADYARQQNDLKQAEIKAGQQRAEQQEKKAMQERAAVNRAAAINAKIAQDKVDSRIKAVNDERLQDKARTQTQEDEEREYIKQQSALNIQQIELETQRLKAKTDLEAAIANDRIKSVEAETAIARKKESAEIDVVQSGADVDRTVAKGIEANLSGTGNEGLYKFLVVISLIILVLLAVFVAWRYSIRQKSSKNVISQEDVNASPVNSIEEEK